MWQVWMRSAMPRPAGVARGEDGGGLVVAEIDLVIRHAAERIKRQRRVADTGRQKPGGGMEGIGPFGNRRAAVVEVVRIDHSAASLTSWAKGRGASGTSFVSTSDEVTTEGMPAPGWVPAPTR